MDSSNRLQLIQGCLRVPEREITPPEWLELLKVIAEEFNPVFKYLGSRPLGQVLNGKYDTSIADSRRGAFTRKTPLGTMSKSPELSLKARCLELCYDFRSLDRVIGNYREWRGLLLFEGKKFALWSGTYHRSGDWHDRALSCVVHELNDQELLLHLQGPSWIDRRSLGYRVLDNLDNALDVLVREREQRVNSMRRVHGFVQQIRSRIIA